jgi:hypothetical protein
MKGDMCMYVFMYEYSQSTRLDWPLLLVANPPYAHRLLPGFPTPPEPACNCKPRIGSSATLLTGDRLIECSYLQIILQPLIHIKARRKHRHDLDVSNRQPDKETLESPLEIYPLRDFGNANAMTVANHAADLHAPPNHLEGVGYCLRDEACAAAGAELRPVA